MTSQRHVVCCKCGCLKKVSNGIVAGLERLFYRLGGLVGRNPWKTIGLCVLVCGMMGVGLINHNEERRYIKNYVPRGSRILAEHDWVTANFPGARVESLIIENENVLTAKAVNAIYDMYETAVSLNTSTGKTMTDICLKAGASCQVSSILEMWMYNRDIIRKLTDEDIHNAVNQDKIINPYYKSDIHADTFLGRVRRDASGKIVGASAAVMLCLLDGNKSSEKEAMEWETHLIHLANKVGHPDLKKVYIYSTRTYDDEAMGTLYNDLKLLFIGFSLVFLYLTVSIGQLSLVHHKIFLASAGLLSIGLAICFTYGFAFVTGIMFGQIHQILPFMLLGIGVDDVFVIMESMNNLSPKERLMSVDERIAHTLKHAGVSITVTSVTDMAAFAIGSTTLIPALSTFCIYTAIGVFALYVLQATFFVACLALDEKRKDSRRDACILCFKHEDTYKPNKMYTFSVQHNFVKNVWAPALTKFPIKVLVLLLYMSLTVLNVWSCMQVRFDYDPHKYLPEGSYATEYVAADRKYFPNSGPYTQIFCDEADYSKNIDTLIQLYENVQKLPTVKPKSATFWLASFQDWSQSQSPHYSAFVYDDAYKNQHRHTHTKTAPAKSSEHVILPSKDAKSAPTDSEPTDSESESSWLSSHLHKLSKAVQRTKVKIDRNRPVSSNTGRTSRTLDPQRHRNYSSVDINNPRNRPGSHQGISKWTLPSASFQNKSFADSVCTFLQSIQGQLFARFVNIDCSAASKSIKGSVMAFRQVRCQTSKCNVDAMENMRVLVDNVTLEGDGKCFVYSDPQYMYNESNQVLRVGLYRNLALAAVSVFVVTLILITNMWTSILVFMCVVCTMIDVAGAMYFWDIYLDIASGVILILCFGLAVDHSAHVGHCFMTTTGTGNERLKKTLVNIGPAVFSGGFSTFLAFSILYFTTSYAFILFCRLFTLVVVFGLFHGLTVLPVILSLVGPPPYETQDFSSQNGHVSKQRPEVTETMLPSSGHLERVGMKLAQHSGSYYVTTSDGTWEEHNNSRKH